MSTYPLPPPSVLGSLYGSFYFGTLLSTLFYGVTCMQTFFYYVHYENDPLRMKILVATIWTLDTIHEALCVSGSYKYIIAGLENPSSFVTGNPELVLLYLAGTLAAITTEGFLVYRIYVFSAKNLVMPLLWVAASLIQLVSIIIYIAKALYTANGQVHVIPLSELDSGSFGLLGTLILSAGAGLDVLIAIFMTFLLIRQRIATGFTSTAHILQRLIVFAVNTGTWSAIFALLTVVFVHVTPSNSLYTVFIIPLCPVFCNTLLANLNARSYVLRGDTTHIDLAVSTGPSLRVSDRATGDRRHEEKSDFSARRGVWKTTEVVTFPDAAQSTTQTIV